MDSFSNLSSELESKQHGSESLEKPDGTLTEPGQPTLDFLMQAHFPSGCEITETPYDYTKSISIQMSWPMQRRNYFPIPRLNGRYFLIAKSSFKIGMYYNEVGYMI